MERVYRDYPCGVRTFERAAGSPYRSVKTGSIGEILNLQDVKTLWSGDEKWSQNLRPGLQAMMKRIKAVISVRLQGDASIHRTISDTRHSCVRICHPACRMFSIVWRLTLAPVRRTASGFKTSKTGPQRKLDGRICSSRISLPSGLQTRCSSFKPVNGSGTEQNTKVANTVSKN